MIWHLIAENMAMGGEKRDGNGKEYGKSSVLYVYFLFVCKKTEGLDFLFFVSFPFFFSCGGLEISILVFFVILYIFVLVFVFPQGKYGVSSWDFTILLFFQTFV